MKNILDFLKNNFIIVKWTVWYFFIVWFILNFIFNFDIFSLHHWWKFFHSTLHGFGGLMFGIIVYSAIPLYIASTLITYRTKEMIIPIPFSQKVSAIMSKIFPDTKEAEATENTPETSEPEIEETKEPEYPKDLPAELRVPFMRAKNRLPLTRGISVYNQPQKKPIQQKEPVVPEPETPSIPIPMDFDVSDTIEPTMSDSIPTFKDLDFDIPIATEKEPENITTEYLKNKNIEYETYKNFIATEKFVIYEHNDKEFWIMDGDSWFAAGKQIDSPINELLQLAKQNELTPVIYLASQNIMDIDTTISNFEKLGIRVIKDLSELN